MKTSAATVVKSEVVELTPAVVLSIPGRHFHHARGQARDVSIEQLRELGRLFLKSALTVGDLYLRLCDHIRVYDLDPDEVAVALRDAGFPPPRISEIRRVAFAPANIYREFMTKGIGFRVALTKTRLYYEVRRRDLRTKRRKLRRASARVIGLVKDLGELAWEYRAKNCRLNVVGAIEHNKHCANYNMFIVLMQKHDSPSVILGFLTHIQTHLTYVKRSF